MIAKRVIVEGAFFKAGLYAAAAVIGYLHGADVPGLGPAIDSFYTALGGFLNRRARAQASRIASGLEELARKERVDLAPVEATLEELFARHGLQASELIDLGLDPNEAAARVRARGEALFISFDEGQQELLNKALKRAYATLIEDTDFLETAQATVLRALLAQRDAIERLPPEMANAVRALLGGNLLDSGHRLPPPRPRESLLLHAEYAVVPFDPGRQPDLAALLAWCKEGPAKGIRLITGAGGMGKTRLALELARQLRFDNWQAGFLARAADSAPAFAIDELLEMDRHLLIIVDYAETRRAAVEDLLRRLALYPSPRRRRVLLLARSAGEWWDDLSTRDGDVRDLFERLGNASLEVPLRALVATAEQRAWGFAAAREAFAKRLELYEPPRASPPDLAQLHFGQPLFLHIAALASLRGDRPETEDELLDWVLRREEGTWRNALETAGLQAPQFFEPFAQGAALLTLAEGAATPQDARTLLRRVPSLVDQPNATLDVLTRILARLYPEAGLESESSSLPEAASGETEGTPLQIAGVRPDVLGEQLVDRQLARDDSLLDAAFGDGASEDLIIGALTVLNRLADRRPASARWLHAAFERSAIAAPGAMATTIKRQAHLLPAGPNLLTQLHYQAACDGDEPLARKFDAAVLHGPRFRMAWSTKVTQPAQVRTFFLSHRSLMQSCAFSPDGRRAISASGDRVLALWDVEQGRTIRELTGHGSNMTSCAFSPDGRQALTASLDRTLILWDLDRGAMVQRLTDHEDGVRSCAFSPDGRRAVSGSADHTLFLWDLELGEPLRRLSLHRDRVTSCAFSPDGRRALSASFDRTLVLWDIESGEVIRQVESHKQWVWACAFSRDGQHALSASQDGTLVLWDENLGEPSHWLRGHYGGVHSCAFSPTGHVAASGSGDRTLILWNLERGEAITRLRGHTMPVWSCVFSPDGRHVLSAAGDLILWDVERCAPVSRHIEPPRGVSSCAFSPDGRYALSGGDHGVLTLWDVQQGRPLQGLVGHSGSVSSCVFSSDGRWALSAGGSPQIVLWDLERGAPLRTLRADGVRSCSFSPDGRYILSASSNGTLLLWDVSQDEPIRELKGHEAWVEACAFSPDGRRALSASLDRTLILWDVEEGAPIRRLKSHEDRVWSCAFSPDGRVALSGSDRGTLITWDVEEGAPIRRLEGHVGRVRMCAFSPDGRCAISASSDRTLILWDVARGDRLAIIALHGLNAAALSPDGQRVLVGDGAGDVTCLEVVGA